MLLNDMALMRAYRETDFVIAAAPMGVLRVGEDAAGAAAVLARCGAVQGVVITAQNPFSELENTPYAANGDLAAAVKRLGRATRLAQGIPRAGDWTPEESLFVLDCTPEEAQRLAYRSRQNAYVWVEAGSAPELRLTVPGRLVVCTRRVGADHLTELLCLDEEPAGLTLSLRRYAPLAIYPRMAGMIGVPAPDFKNGLVVAGIDVRPDRAYGTIVGGPMTPVEGTAPLPLDPGDLAPARSWLAALDWDAAHQRLAAVIGA